MMTVTYMKNVNNATQDVITEMATVAKRLGNKVRVGLVNGWMTVNGLLAVNKEAEEVMCDRYGFNRIVDTEVEHW